MLQGGDELGRSQAGNNNAYCQDNPMTWLDWRDADEKLIDFVAALIALRRRFPQLRQTRWLTGEPQRADACPDVLWWHPAGRAMRVGDWQSRKLGAFGLHLTASTAAGDRDAAQPDLLCLINRDDIPVSFLLPPGSWQQVCDSSADEAFASCQRERATPVAARSVQILCRRS